MQSLPAQAERVQLSALVDRFYDTLILTRSENTAVTYRVGLRFFVKFAARFGAEFPEDVAFDLIEDYLLAIRRENLCAKTANHRLAAIRSFWKWMRRRGYTKSDPANDVERMRVSKHMPKYLSVADQERLLSGLAKETGDIGRRDEAIIATALLTGLRCDELSCLCLADVDLESGILRIGAGKGDKGREVPVIPRLAAILTAYLPVRDRLLDQTASQWFFVSAKAGEGPGAKGSPKQRGEQLGRHAIFARVRLASVAHLGRAISPHILRHSFAVRLRENGADLQLIQETLGHANIATTTIYASMATSRRLKIVGELLK